MSKPSKIFFCKELVPAEQRKIYFPALSPVDSRTCKQKYINIAGRVEQGLNRQGTSRRTNRLCNCEKETCIW